MKQVYLATALFVALFLPACGSGGSSSAGSVTVASIVPGASSNGSTPSPTPGSTAAVSAPVTQSMILGAQTIALPGAQNLSGSGSFTVAQENTPETKLTVSSVDATLPQSVTRTMQSGIERNAVYSFQIQVTASLGFSGLPGFTISSPAFAGLRPAQLTYTVFKGAGCTDLVYAGQAASDITGNTATFANGASAITLDPLAVYTFVFYVEQPVIDANAEIFLTEPQQNTVVGLKANGTGTSAILQSISGPATGLNNPTDIKVGLDGTIYVLNRGNADSFTSNNFQDATETITQYAPQANGDMVPLRTFTGLNKNGIVHRIGISDSGQLYVEYDGFVDAVVTTKPSSNGLGIDTITSDLVGGYFTIPPSGVAGNPLTSGVIQGFAVSTDDVVAQVYSQNGFAVGPDESSGPDDAQFTFKLGTAIQYNVLFPDFVLAFNPSSGKLFESRGSSISILNRDLTSAGAYFLDAIQGPAPSIIAFDRSDDLFALINRTVNVYANSSQIPAPLSGSYVDVGITYAATSIDLDNTIGSSAVGGMAIGERK